MSGHFEYLKAHLFDWGKAPLETVVGFVPLDMAEHREYIGKIGELPLSLRELHETVGAGVIRQSLAGVPQDPSLFRCSFLSPREIWRALVNFYDEPQYSRFDVRREVPFYKMEQGEYLVFKKNSKGVFIPGIFDPTGCKVAESLEEFVHRCYFEDATYWLHIATPRKAPSKSASVRQAPVKAAAKRKTPAKRKPR